MSILGTIIVYTCDGEGCSSHVSVHTADDRERLASQWTSGRNLNFCPACRFMLRNAAAIEADELCNSVNSVNSGTSLKEAA